MHQRPTLRRVAQLEHQLIPRNPLLPSLTQPLLFHALRHGEAGTGVRPEQCDQGIALDSAQQRLDIPLQGRPHDTPRRIHPHRLLVDVR